MDKRVVLAPFRYERSPIFFNTLDYYGFLVRSQPLIELSISGDLSAFDDCARRLASFDVVVFSSPSVVQFFFQRLKALDIDPTRLDYCYLITIGSATATALRKHGFSPDFVPSEFSSKSLVNALNRANKRWEILIPCSNRSLWHATRHLSPSYRLFTPVLYDNTVPMCGKQRAGLMRIDDADVIAFTSPSSVEGFFAMYSEAPLTQILRTKLVASIGPTTARACNDRGVKVSIQPQKYTITAMMWSIINHFNALGVD